MAGSFNNSSGRDIDSGADNDAEAVEQQRPEGENAV
jgi:hypothetical protein